MAKDDYSVITLKILGYLYGCLKNGEPISRDLFSPYSTLFRVNGEAINEPYWYSILFMLTKEGLISGLGFTKAFGEDVIMFNDIVDCRITPAGIHHLEEHGSMKKAWKVLMDTKDVMVTMLTKVLPF